MQNAEYIMSTYKKLQVLNVLYVVYCILSVSTDDGYVNFLLPHGHVKRTAPFA